MNAYTPAPERHDDYQGKHAIGTVARRTLDIGVGIPPLGAYSDKFLIQVAMTGRNRAPQDGYRGQHRKAVNLRKRYVNGVGKINLNKVNLRKSA